MAILAVKTDRMDITLVLSSGYIFVQQKWKYNWLIDPNYPNVSPWTIEEKRNFHNRADQLIWKLWSSKAYAYMTGNSKIAQEYRNTKFKINIDIRWVKGREYTHWNVDVYKIPPGVVRGSGVRWAARQIELDSQDTTVRTESFMRKQIPITHELGHTFRNAPNSSLGILDEYENTSSYFSDKHSIMNVGTEVRVRHFNYLKEQLNLLLPSALFDICMF